MTDSDINTSSTFKDNVITGGHVHIGHSIHIQQHDFVVEQRKQFLESLRFNEVEWRKSQIDDAFPKTFEWIFSGQASRWDDFVAWLQSDEQWYWVNGKPGSGKSTLMKFLVSDQRTQEVLKDENDPVPPLILSHYFWLIGAEHQRTLKGCLGTLLLQLCESDDDVVKFLFDKNRALLKKRSFGDWSKRELLNNMRLVLMKSRRRVCLFLDGLDELDSQSEDVEELFDVFESLCSYGIPGTEKLLLKICTSSRIEPSFQARLSEKPQLRLQDLNERDILILVTKKVRKFISAKTLTSKKQVFPEDIIDILVQKAEGVFLWVRLALKSVFRGVQNDDDLEMLLRRLEELPTEMHQLYQQMWRRLNEDEALYRKEAARYFSQVENHNPNLLQITFATDGELQDKCYAAQEIDQELLKEVVDACEATRIKIQSRSAGLLEVTSGYLADRYRSVCLGGKNTRNHGRHQLQFQLLSRLSSQVQFIHRTAGEFLFQTDSGRTIFGNTDKFEQKRELINGELASYMGAFLGLHCIKLHDIIKSFDRWCENHTDLDLQITMLRRLDNLIARHMRVWHPETSVEDRWGTLAILSNDDRGPSYWTGGLGSLPWDLYHLAARRNIELLSMLVNHDDLSSYYKGYLIVCLTNIIELGYNFSSSRCSDVLKLTIQLTYQGANLRVRHPIMQYRGGMDLFRLVSPIECVVTAMQYDLEVTERLMNELGFENFLRFLMFLKQSDKGENTLVHLSSLHGCFRLGSYLDTYPKGALVTVVAAISDLLDMLILFVSNNSSSRDKMCNKIRPFSKSVVKGITMYNLRSYKPSQQESAQILSICAKAYTFPASSFLDFEHLQVTIRDEVLDFCENLDRQGTVGTLLELYSNPEWFLMGYTTDRKRMLLLPLDPKADIDEHNWKERGSLRMWSEKNKNSDLLVSQKDGHYRTRIKSVQRLV